MVQFLVISMIRIITSTFFRRIDVVGLEHVPADGAIIFAGNHPNALMDGWLLTAKCGRWPLHFVANAKLWKYRMLVPILNATGAVPVYRREEHDGDVDNQRAFETLYDVIESGNCMGIFPEGVSHVESKLLKLKTGAARIALTIAARGRTCVKIVPCGLSYIHRHRFRSQVLIEFGQPITIDDEWMMAYRENDQATVGKLTDHLAEALAAVTLNAPDWRSLRFAQTVRRLYKPSTAVLSPGEYVELTRRFVERYDVFASDPEMQAFQNAVEDYQARLDMLGLKDYQLRKTITLGDAFRKIVFRAFTMVALLPLAIPGALLHLPVGWIAAAVGERYSYEMDDIATLKVFATILLLPTLYLIIAILIGVNFGFWWSLAAIVGLTVSFFASVRLIEAEVGLFLSVLSVLRLARLGSEVDDLGATRKVLVTQVRALVDRLAPDETTRMFTSKDFAQK